MCVGLIHAVRAAVLTDHCPEHARTEHPLVQFPPALAERIFKTLLRPCSEAIERDRKACNAHSRHKALPFVSRDFTGDLMMVSLLLRLKSSGILDEYPN